MKKIYFSGKFNRLKQKELTLEQSLANDYRTQLLGNPELLTKAQKNLTIGSQFIYTGPFYCEQASNGEYTSTDCSVVLNEELKAVQNSDVFIAVFDKSFSVGTVVELEWALNQNKKVIILYRPQSSVYQIKSEYWFAIADALRQNPNTKIYSYQTSKQMMNLMLKILKEEI